MVFIYLNNKRTNDEKAATEIGKVLNIYDAGATDSRQYPIAINGLPERGVMGLKAIVENYGGTGSGELARFYLANAYFNLHQYDEALRHFESFSGDGDLLRASAEAGAAACYEVKGSYSRAAEKYEKAANRISNAAQTPDYLNAAARCFGSSGEKEKAIALLKRLKKEFPTSTAARDADRYIALFSA